MKNNTTPSTIKRTWLVAATLCCIAILVVMLYVVSNISAQASTNNIGTLNTTVNITGTTTQSATTDGETPGAVADTDSVASSSVTGYDADGGTVTGTVITQEAVDDDGNPIEDTAESGLGDAELIIIEE